jgi:NhaA family Na+:H+ antiporter
VTLGLLTPSHPFQPPAAVSAEAKRTADRTSDDPDPPDLDTAEWLELAWLSREAVSPIARIEHALLPWSSFVVVPVFALANAGVPLSWGALAGVFTSGLGLAIVVARVVGKPLGIVGAARAAVAARAGALPGDVAWGDVAGMGAAAGIGFTVALFVAELAFPDGSEALADAKVAILVASVLAGAIGTIALRRGRGRRPAPPGGADSP